MRDYFKFDVRFVMNITDVDDKVRFLCHCRFAISKKLTGSFLRLQIIFRARQQHLFSEFVASHPKIDDEALGFADAAYKEYLAKKLPLLDPSVPAERYQAEVEQAYATVLNGGALDGREKPGDEEAKIKMHIKTVSSAADALAKARNGTQLLSDRIWIPYGDQPWERTSPSSLN
jgi:cysteinyl-tRNA synthetase